MINNQPSNVVIVDVLAQAPAGSTTPVNTYTPPSNYPAYYYPGYINPYNNNPQAALDLAVANHAYQKSLTNYYSKYYGTYPYWMGV